MNSVTETPQTKKVKRNAFEVLKDAAKEQVKLNSIKKCRFELHNTPQKVSRKRKDNPVLLGTISASKDGQIPAQAFQAVRDNDDLNPVIELEDLYKASKRSDDSEDIDGPIEIMRSKTEDKPPSPPHRRTVINTRYSYDINVGKGFYKSYPTGFKEEFILIYLSEGLAKACLQKSVSVDVASKWIKAYKSQGLLGLVDKRAGNSGTVNKYLDAYVLDEFRKKREKGIMVNSLMLKAFALQAPPSIRPESFTASNGWLVRFLNRNQISRRKKTHLTQVVVEKLNKEMQLHLQTLNALSESGENIIYVNFDDVPVMYDLSSDYIYEMKRTKDIISQPQSEQNKSNRNACDCI